ncbi:MAG: phosphoenolpyruvate kinase [Myxococcales bacterium]|nr:phosphoenolpyruvate kinase [Myxococcales bacterium]
MPTSTLADDVADTLNALEAALDQFKTTRPGERGDRQPVHVVYGGAHLFRRDTAARLGALARRSLGEYAGDAFTFARAMGLPGADALRSGETEAAARARMAADPEAMRSEDRPTWLALTVYDRVRDKLEREPVEDFRLDFEDGYGNRPDAEEDATAVSAAEEVAAGLAEGTLPPFCGIRIKPLEGALLQRSIRTLDIFVTTLLERAGRLPDNFVVTLPKICVPEQVSTLVRLFEALERRVGLDEGALQFEVMIELVHGLFDQHGAFVLPQLHAAAEGRCVAAHFGTYDFTASFGVTATHQRMDHPGCDFALDLMKAAFAETGIWLSDGSTNIMPVAIHRAGAGESLSDAQLEANRAAVHGAWRLAHYHNRRSLIRGFYQGWDLHPAQIPARYAACYGFFLEGFDAAATRLRNFIEQAAKATLVGEVFDDAATGQGLLNYFLRALACGAVSLDELAVTGLREDELRTRSFLRILEGRRGA